MRNAIETSDFSLAAVLLASGGFRLLDVAPPVNGRRTFVLEGDHSRFQTLARLFHLDDVQVGARALIGAQRRLKSALYDDVPVGSSLGDPP